MLFFGNKVKNNCNVPSSIPSSVKPSIRKPHDLDSSEELGPVIERESENTPVAWPSSQPVIDKNSAMPVWG